MSHRLASKLIELAREGNTLTKRFAYAILCSAVTKHELNHLSDKNGLQVHGTRFFSRHRDYNQLNNGEDMPVSRKKTVLTTYIVVDALHVVAFSVKARA